MSVRRRQAIEPGPNGVGGASGANASAVAPDAFINGEPQQHRLARL